MYQETAKARKYRLMPSQILDQKALMQLARVSEKPWRILGVDADIWLRQEIYSFLFCYQYITTNAESYIQNNQFYAPKFDHGVYFLIDDGCIVYVGQSSRLSCRIMEHFKNKQFDSIFCLNIQCPPLRDDVEAYYIHKFQPYFNIHYPGTQNTIVDREDKVRGNTGDA